MTDILATVVRVPRRVPSPWRPVQLLPIRAERHGFARVVDLGMIVPRLQQRLDEGGQHIRISAAPGLLVRLCPWNGAYTYAWLV